MADVNKLRELLAKATPGPWVVVTGKNISVGPCPGQRVAVCNYDNGPIEKANAALIAAMRNDIEELLAIAEASESLRADAMRYRWLRPHIEVDHDWADDLGQRWSWVSMDSVTVPADPHYATPDAAIDAAMSEMVPVVEGS